MITGRVHPGEPNGSLMLQNMLYLLAQPIPSQKISGISYLIIPMINVDGVVAGNYRTGLSGKDLNRMYGRKNALCPEVQ